SSTAMAVGAMLNGWGFPGFFHIHIVVTRWVIHTIHGHIIFHIHLHAHIFHGAFRTRPQVGHGRGHAFAGRQGAAGIAAAIHRFSKHRVWLLFFGLDDDVVGFSNADTELIHRHRLHVLAVHVNHGHLQSGDAHVKGR